MLVRTLLLLLLIATAAILPWLPSGTMYWRDAPEFLLSAIYLDIPHPPGFPTYGSLANLFTFLPYGPLIWRVQLFSVYTTLACLWLSWLICKELARVINPSTEKSPFLLISFFIGIGSLAFSPSVIRQTITAEAYQLNALFILLLVYGGFRYQHTKDIRWALTAAFVSGLGLGNHPSLLLIALPVGALFLPAIWQQHKKAILFVPLLGMMGALVYLYLPVRATANPPLNTGSPTTIERFLHTTTSARDRALRPAVLTTIGRLDTQDIQAQIQITKNDAEHLTDELGWILPALGGIGLFLGLFRLHWSTALSLAVATGMPLFFFRGWQPDPWMPTFFLLLAVAAALLAEVLQKQKNLMRCTMLLILLSLTVIQAERTTDEISEQLTYNTPQKVTADLLSELPSHSLFLTESSWFLASALHHIEGVREDLTIGYLPHWLFPAYFREMELEVAGAAIRSERDNTAPSTAPNRKNLGALLTAATRADIPIFIEPALVINKMLAKAAYDTPNGLIAVGPAESTHSSLTFSPRLLTAGEKAKHLPRSYLQADAASYTETRAVGLADFLFQQGHKAKAASGLATLCDRPDLHICSEQTYISLAQYYLLMNEKEKARKTLQSLATEGRSGVLTEYILQELERS